MPRRPLRMTATRSAVLVATETDSRTRASDIMRRPQVRRVLPPGSARSRLPRRARAAAVTAALPPASASPTALLPG